jgi:ATP-dependent helicase/nuclease subunit A
VTLTPSQRHAVTLAGRDVCVVAGAGSGKTTVLTERFAHQVLARGSVDERLKAVDRLLTLTFTEKAATEMRRRVAERFLEEGRPDLRRAVETAWVSTFHSFCARLLKENAVEAGVDPSFQVLAEGDAALLLDEARDATVLRWAGERPADLAALGPLAGKDFEETISRLVAAGAGPGRTFAELFEEAANPPPPAAEVDAVRDALKVLAKDLGRYAGAAADAARAAVEAGKAMDGVDPAAAGPAVAAVRKSFRMPGVDPKAAQVPAKPRLQALQQACDAALEALTAIDAAPAARALAALLDEIARAYAERKREHGALDFADLEERALDLLEHDEEVREEARERFEGILVDEFQDTSPVQERLLTALSVPGRRFVVGDPKQAIYGFRGADVAGFGRARAAAGPDGVVPLVENFRSRPEVLRFSNALLAPAFALGGADQVPFERLEPAAGHGPKAAPSVEVHVVGGEGTLGDLRPREAALLAARIRALVEGGGCITRRYNEERPEGSALRWGDAAILLRSMSDIKVYERALADADVPYQVVKGRGFYEAREVVDLANLLQALEDPSDDLALAATLRSPFAGLDDGALLALVDALPRVEDPKPHLSLHLATGRPPVPGLSPAMRRRLDRFRAAWHLLDDLRRRDRLHGLVDAALRETGYDLAVLLRPGGRQRAANLRKVRERARSFEADGLGGTGDFVRLLRRLRLREERETEAPLATEDAVAVLTVHQAKGLEWPLVCVPDLARQGGGKSPPSVLVRGGRAGLKLRGEKKSAKTPLWRRLEEEGVRAGNAEEVRLLHVAVTRAMEHLVLSACVKGSADPDEDDDDGPGEPKKHLRAFDCVEPLLPAPDAASKGEEDRVVVLEKGTPDEVAIRVVRTAGPGAGRGGARRVSLALLRRKRLLAGRGPGRVPGAKLPAKERREVERSVRAVLDRPPVPVDGTPYLATVSAVLDFEACPLRYYLGHVVGAPDRAPPSLGEPTPRVDFPVSRGDASLGGEPARRLLRPGADDEEWEGGAGGDREVPRWVSGVAVHAVLGTLDFTADHDAGAVREAARARLREELDEDPPAEALDRVAEWVRTFRASDLGRAAAAAARRQAKTGEPGLLREVPFLSREEGVLLRGQIDLAVRGEDGVWTLADYKASRPPKRRDGADRYVRQLRLYARALRGVPLFKEAPAFRGALVYLDPKIQVVDVQLDAAALEPARGLLQRFAKSTAAERFPPDRSHCLACPFGPGGRRSCGEGVRRGKFE